MGIRLLAFPSGHGKVLLGVGIALVGSIGGGGALPRSMGGISVTRSEAVGPSEKRGSRHGRLLIFGVSAMVLSSQPGNMASCRIMEVKSPYRSPKDLLESPQVSTSSSICTVCLRTPHMIRHGYVSSQFNILGVKYVTTMVAPALRIPCNDSNAISFKSNTPAFAPAWIMANSPLTWYAAIGRSLPISFASLMMSRYALAGLTYEWSAKSGS